jgi:hypothetical protein
VTPVPAVPPVLPPVPVLPDVPPPLVPPGVPVTFVSSSPHATTLSELTIKEPKQM